MRTRRAWGLLRMNRRAFLLVSALALSPLLMPLHARDARATVAALLTMDDLVGGSTSIVVATAGERRSAWEDLPSGRCIVTYTKLTVERSVVGAPGREIWVRTLGGVVGKIGQAVSGEAQIEPGSRALLFLTQASGAVVVTAMGQGDYPIVTDDEGVARLAASPDRGMLIPKGRSVISAQDELIGSKLDDGIAMVIAANKARDEKK
jgi:hypothetical protein